jgi:hypothetical protein
LRHILCGKVSHNPALRIGDAQCVQSLVDRSFITGPYHTKHVGKQFLNALSRMGVCFRGIHYRVCFRLGSQANREYDRGQEKKAQSAPLTGTHKSPL